jgi:hypothetical protein
MSTGSMIPVWAQEASHSADAASSFWLTFVQRLL